MYGQVNRCLSFFLHLFHSLNKPFNILQQGDFMSRFIFILIFTAFICLVSGHNSCFAASEEEISELISKLGAPGFKERNDASALLRKIGYPARKALEEAVKSNDPEIKTRAQKILNDIKLGINPAWPEDLRTQVRGYDKLDSSGKRDFITRLVAQSEKEAIPFLLARVDKGDSSDADIAIERLLAIDNKEDLWKEVLERKDKPVNKYQAQLLLRACQWSGKFADIIRSLKNPHLPENSKKKIIKVRIEALREYLDEKEYKNVDAEAKVLAKAVPDNAMILYLQAEALLKLGRSDEAIALEDKALSLNPDKESPHYTAGSLLMEMGKFRLAEKEWKKILEIPPVDDVYDINAYMRLANIYSQSKLYKKALEALETGAKKFKKAKEKNGSGMGMIGADTLEGKIAHLRKRARNLGDARGMQIKDQPPEKRDLLNFNIKMIVKDGKYAEMQKEMKDVTGSMGIKVQPHGIGLLKKKIVTLNYDREKNQMAVMMGETACAIQKNFIIKQPSVKVAVTDLDTINIYKVDRDTEKVELLNSFEKEYEVRISKTQLLRTWTDPVVTINNKNYSWKELSNRLPMDFLPEKFKVEVKGVSASGKQKTIKYTLDPEKLKSWFDKK